MGFVQKAFQLFSKYLLFLGDFNAHSPLWGYPREDERGRILINFSFRNNLIILNDPSSLPTFQLPHIHGWPDISLCSVDLFPELQDWQVLDFPTDNHSLLGDHRPIQITLSPRLKDPPRRRYRTKDVPLGGFLDQLHSDLNKNNFSFQIQNNETQQSFDQKLKTFTQYIIESAENHLKKRKTFHTPRISWWSLDLKIKRNKMRAVYKKTKLQNSTDQDVLNLKNKSGLQKSSQGSEKGGMDEVLPR